MEPRYITLTTADGALVLTVTESMLTTFEMAQILSAELLTAVNAAKEKNVVLDLKNVQMMTSATLLVLTRLNTTVESRGGRLVLCNLQEVVAQTLPRTRQIAT